MLVAYSWFVSFINYLFLVYFCCNFIYQAIAFIEKKKKTKIGCVELLICINISVFFSLFSRASRFWYQSNLKIYFKLILIGPEANKYWRNKMKAKNKWNQFYFFTSTWHWWWTFYWVILLVIQISNISNAFLPFNKYIY